MALSLRFALHATLLLSLKIFKVVSSGPRLLCAAFCACVLMVAVWRLIMRASADINDGAFPPHFRRDSLRDASHARTVRAVGSSFTVYKRANSEVTAIIMYVCMCIVP